jgi:hypothetical protein
VITVDKHTLNDFVVDGDRYADTAHLSPHDLAKLIVTDLTDPNNPYTLPTHFTYEITVNTTGPLPHLLIQVGGITPADGEMAADAALVTINHAVKQYGQLRGIFERNLRFDHTLIVTTPDGHQRSVPSLLTTSTPAFPPDTVLLAPASPHAVPMRAPDHAWGLVIVGARPTDTAPPPRRAVGDAPDPAHTDIAELLAGVWLPAPPPADLHTGDLVVRLHPPTHNPTGSPVTDVEVLAATRGQWRMVRTWRSLDTRWPHEIAMTVCQHMRHTAAIVDRPFTAPPRPEPDALTALINNRLVDVGEQVAWNGHIATIRDGGVLDDGGPHEFSLATVTELATRLAGYPVNGWHLWHRTRDHRPLSDLRTELATRHTPTAHAHTD